MMGARFLTYGYIVSTIAGVFAGYLFGGMAGWLVMWLGGGMLGLTMAYIWHVGPDGEKHPLDLLCQEGPHLSAPRFHQALRNGPGQ